MGAIASFIGLAFEICIWIILLQVAVSWLLIFGVINIEHPQARNLVGLLEKVTDPVYKPIRKYVPPIGGIDITPIVVILGLSLLQGFLISALT